MIWSKPKAHVFGSWFKGLGLVKAPLVSRKADIVGRDALRIQDHPGFARLRPVCTPFSLEECCPAILALLLTVRDEQDIPF